MNLVSLERLGRVENFDEKYFLQKRRIVEKNEDGNVELFI